MIQAILFSLWFASCIAFPGFLLATRIFKHNPQKYFFDSIISGVIYGIIINTIIGVILAYIHQFGLFSYIGAIGCLILILLSLQKTPKITLNHQDKQIAIIVGGIFLLLCIYANLPGILFHETDSFFWVSQAKLNFVTHSLTPLNFDSIYAPQFYSLLIAESLSVMGIQTTATTLIKLFGITSLTLLAASWINLSRSIFTHYWKQSAILGGSIILSSPWTLSFLMGFDLSPKIIGLSILFLAINTFHNGGHWYRLLFLCIGLYIIHVPELFFFILPISILWLCKPKLRQEIKNQHWLWLALVYVGYVLIKFFAAIMGFVGTTNTGAYTQIPFTLFDILKILGPGAIIILIYSVFARRPLGFALSLALFSFLFLQFPSAFTIASKAFWQTSRLLLYANIGMALLIIPPKKKSYLIALILFQIVWIGKSAASIYINNLGQLPTGLVQKAPSSIQALYQKAQASQSIHRRLIPTLEMLPLTQTDHIFVDVQDNQAMFYILTILIPHRIATTSLPLNPRVLLRTSPYLFVDATIPPYTTWIITDNRPGNIHYFDASTQLSTQLYIGKVN